MEQNHWQMLTSLSEIISEEVEFGDTSRLVEMIGLTQDMVSGFIACKDMRTEFC